MPNATKQRDVEKAGGKPIEELIPETWQALIDEGNPTPTISDLADRLGVQWITAKSWLMVDCGLEPVTVLRKRKR